MLKLIKVHTHSGRPSCSSTQREIYLRVSDIGECTNGGSGDSGFAVKQPSSGGGTTRVDGGGFSEGKTTRLTTARVFRNHLRWLGDVKSDVQIGTPQLQTSTEQRRYWSTNLYRRFVNTLQRLGGSKEIHTKKVSVLQHGLEVILRELMDVGFT
ncbi:hypothetical protein M8C21_006669 [Ambrosia artemisiifolia]|uniref:Uncharacterized protein n=1 Tax=Ambrosia artemisiifolia TaxID=4212 RepID=A0AAD5C012_AMBAR|nr:hypothetical protein M8C21_006669 [Ambrosia artemisiifolia]